MGRVATTRLVGQFSAVDGRVLIAPICLLIATYSWNHVRADETGIVRAMPIAAEGPPGGGAGPASPVAERVRLAEATVRQATTRPSDEWSFSFTDMRELLPDPTTQHIVSEKRLAWFQKVAAQRPASAYKRLLAWYKATRQLVRGHLTRVDRPNKVYMSLAECIERALANNYTIRVEGYRPAIEATRIVESEAVFDTNVFFNYTEDTQDRPSSAPQLQGTRLDNRSFAGGLRKLLPTGMQVEGRYSFARSESDLQFQTINPSYTNNYIVQLRQPLMRGFGLDFNRSQIEIANNNQQISRERFRRQSQDILLDVEERYWELVRARRDVPIVATLLAQSEQTLEVVNARLELDSIPGAIRQTKARVASFNGEYVRVMARVRDAEDRLKGLLNDPELNLLKDVEIVPTDDLSAKTISGGAVDTIASVQTALDYRTELREAKLAVENAHIAVGVAKNQALPRLDLSFQVTYAGLGSNPDSSWDQLNSSDFISYMIMVDIDWPVGNRGPRAALRRARLEQSQALMNAKRVSEAVILEVDLSAREVQTSYDQIRPSIEQALASADQIRVLELRQERMDQSTLNTVFAAQESLASARRSLLQALVGYNIAIVRLERSKGTLLQYDNVDIKDEQ
jgi:outer membrane protein TolC